MQIHLHAVALLSILTLSACSGGGGGGPSRSLVFETSPTIGTAGRTLAAIVVAIRDGNGALIPTATDPVTLVVAAGSPGVVLSGTTTVAAVAGRATFDDLSIGTVGSSIELVASSVGARSTTSASLETFEDATQLVITSVLPSSIEPLRAFDVTVELRRPGGAVAAQLEDEVTLELDALPDLLWHSSGNATRVTELVEVDGGASVVKPLPTGSNEILTATWYDELGAVMATDIQSRLRLIHPVTGDEIAFQGTLGTDNRGLVSRDSVLHSASPHANDRFVVDARSGGSTDMGEFTLDGGTTVLAGVLDMDVDETDDLIYCIAKPGSGQRRLATLDLLAFDMISLGSLGDNFASLTFTRAGVLYGVTGDGAAVPETLYLIDKANASKTLVGALGNGNDGEAIAWVPRRLRGTTNVQAVAGVATFTNVWFEQIGTDATLRATTAALDSGPSDLIQVTGDVVPAASVSFENTFSSTTENVGGGSFGVNLVLSAPVDYALPVMVKVTGVEATVGGPTPDIDTPSAVLLLFQPGQTVLSMSIDIVDDSDVEGVESLTLTISSARLATSISPTSTHTLTIFSDD